MYPQTFLEFTMLPKLGLQACANIPGFQAYVVNLVEQFYQPKAKAFNLRIYSQH